jgi:sensor histidine kinase regulating citrate/malate metabolism
MFFVRNASIQSKLTLVIFFASVLGLSFTCMALELYERVTFRSSMTSELSAQADMLGLNTGASLGFNDQKSARDTLASIRVERHIIAGCIYDSHGILFAEYRRTGIGSDFQIPVWREDGAVFEAEALTLYRSIFLNSERIGSVALVSDFSELRTKMRHFRETSAIVLFVSILITALVSHRLVRLITEPILPLAGIARGSCTRAWGERTEGRDSAHHPVLVAGCSRAFCFPARPSRGGQSGEPTAGDPAFGETRALRGGGREWARGACGARK